MKFINITSEKSSADILSVIKKHDDVNRGVVFDDRHGIPRIKVKEKGCTLRITCEMMNRPTKDDGFLVGTYFKGKLTEKNGVTTLRGIILTAPIYHLILIAFFIGFIVMCIQKGGFSIVPICLMVFDIFMFWGEFRKQGVIARYLYRAFRYAEKNIK